VDTHHVVFYKKLKNKSTIIGEEVWRKQSITKHPSIYESSIFDLFVAKNLYKQDDVEQQCF
jgi:hypothetical protein